MFNNEKENIELVNHKFALPKYEDKLLKKWKAKYNI